VAIRVEDASPLGRGWVSVDWVVADPAAALDPAQAVGALAELRGSPRVEEVVSLHQASYAVVSVVYSGNFSPSLSVTMLSVIL
jgi:hypothetical protein